MIDDDATSVRSHSVIEFEDRILLFLEHLDLKFSHSVFHSIEALLNPPKSFDYACHSAIEALKILTFGLFDS